MGFDLLTYTQRALDALADALDADGIDVPSRRYVTGAQQIAFDDEQFVGHCSNVYPGNQPGLQQPGEYLDSLSLFNADLGFTLVRCIDVDPPIPDKLLADQGRQTLDDGAALLRAAISTYEAGTLLADTCDRLMIGPLTWIGPSGGVVGVNLGLTFRIL